VSVEIPYVPSRRRRENDAIDRGWHEYDGQIPGERKSTSGRTFTFTMRSASPFMRRKKLSARNVVSPESSMSYTPALPTSARPLPTTNFRVYVSSPPSPPARFTPSYHFSNCERSSSQASHIDILEAHKDITAKEQTAVPALEAMGAMSQPEI